MTSLRPLRPVLVLGVLLASVSLAACSTGGADTGAASTPAPTAASPTPTDAWAGAPEPASMDEDRSAPAVCGQLSSLSTLELNATDGLQQGTLTQAQYDALSAAARFGYERLSSADARLDDALDAAHEYLDAHPAPASGPAIEDSSEWDLVTRAMTTACQDAGSNVVAAAQYGG